MPHTKTQKATTRIIRCGIGSEAYCLEMSSVDSVGEASLVHWLPVSTDDGQVGTVVLGRDHVPVFSLAHRLGRPHLNGDERQHIVLLKTSLGRWALLVESVSRVLQVNLAHVHLVPSVALDTQKKLFKGVIVFPRDRHELPAPTSFAGVETRRTRDSAEMALLLSPERLHPHSLPPEIEPEPEASAVTFEPTATTEAEVTKTKHRGQVMLLSVTDAEPDSRRCSFGLSLSQILEVVSSLEVVPVPHAPPYVQGIACWRDQPVPVLDLAARFGLPSAIHEQRLVIARGSANGNLVAFPVESVIRSQRLPLASRPCQVPSGIRADLLRGAFELDSETLMIPDLSRVLTCI